MVIIRKILAWFWVSCLKGRGMSKGDFRNIYKKRKIIVCHHLFNENKTFWTVCFNLLIMRISSKTPSISEGGWFRNKLFPLSWPASCQHARLNHQSCPQRPPACRDSFSCPTGSTPASLTVNTAVRITVPACHAAATNHRLRIEMPCGQQFITDRYCT